MLYQHPIKSSTLSHTQYLIASLAINYPSLIPILYVNQSPSKLSTMTHIEYNNLIAFAENSEERSNVTSVRIPDTVTEMGYRGFVNCSALASITIPQSITGIGECIFGNCFLKCNFLTLSRNATIAPASPLANSS